jgi:hypothetical protein
VLRRRRPEPTHPDLPVGAFLVVLREVERAKDAVVAAVPSARSPGRPLVDALLEFDTRLATAADAMGGWRHDAVASQWTACSRGVEEARRRGEHLRLTAPELGFESMLGRIQELIDPLDPFEDAAARFRELGASLR